MVDEKSYFNPDYAIDIVVKSYSARKLSVHGVFVVEKAVNHIKITKTASFMP